ncbi:unnamed protein product [Discosporangium mesarthrocarpum]
MLTSAILLSCEIAPNTFLVAESAVTHDARHHDYSHSLPSPRALQETIPIVDPQSNSRTSPTKDKYDPEAAVASPERTLEGEQRTRARLADDVEEAIIPPGTQSVLVLGQGVIMEASVSCVAIIVEGLFSGTIKTKYMVLKEGGMVKGMVECSEAVVAGDMDATVSCKRLLALRPTARVSGGVVYGLLRIASGAIITGSLMHKPPERLLKHSRSKSSSKIRPMLASVAEPASAFTEVQAPATAIASVESSGRVPSSSS